MNLTKLAIRRPVLVAMIMVGLAGIGLFCYYQLPQETFPEVDFPFVTVMTVYEGAGPEEIEQLISKELEDEISTVEGIKHLYSISQQGMSLVMIEFYLEIDVDVAAADVRAKVDLVRQLLPEAAEDPVVQKFDFNAQPVMSLAVSAPRPLRDVFHTTDKRIKDRLATVPGVAAVNLIGGQDREIHILTNQQRMRSQGLSIVNVVQAIANANLETPGGHISQNTKEYNIRLRGKFADLDEIRNMRVFTPSGKSIYLRDVADVEDTFKEIRDKVRASGEACVGISVQKRADGNVVAVDKAVRKQIAKLESILPEDFEISIQDEQAFWITSSIDNVFQNMYIGILLTAVALFLFLHTFRSVLVVAMTMPISVIATFIIMYAVDFTLNMMSLMGLAMTVGVLVNNAILVLENITRYLHMDYSPQEAADKGTSEIAVAVSSTTLTNVVVFVPIAFMGGIVGQFFMDFGLTATFATIVSLFISFTLAPTLAAKLLTKENTGTGGTGILARFGRGFDRNLIDLKNVYSRVLGWCLRHRWITLLMIFVVLIASFQLPKFIGSEFLTNMDQGKFSVSIEMPTGTRLEETDAAVHKIETVLRDKTVLPELVRTYASIGRTIGNQIGGASQAVNIGQINVTLIEKAERQESTEEIINRIRPVLAEALVPGARMKLLELGGDGEGEAPILIDLTSDNLERLKEFSEKFIAIVRNETLIPGAVDVDTNYREGQPEVRIIPDRDKCRDNQVDVKYLSQVIVASFEGLLVSEFREGAFNYDIRVKSDESSRDVLTDISELTVMNNQGALIPLPQLADIEFTSGPARIFRKDRQSQIQISSDASSRSTGEIVADIKKETAKLQEEYPECNVFFAGSIEMMEESFGRMGISLLMAICLTYMLLASLLESFTQPLVIMFSLPLSMIGVFIGLFLMGGTFSIFSIMSIIMLVGLVINNSIIVIDHANHLRQKGMVRYEALIESGQTRLRPILMANLTTVAALIPLALGMGWGGEMRAPMAMVQIGGLIAGGWMGLIIIPVIYTISDDFNHFVYRLLRIEKKKK